MGRVRGQNRQAEVFAADDSCMDGWLLPAASFVLGAVFGSFANVVIYRVPAGLSIVRPGSNCPACNRPIPWYDNLPLLSYLVLRGRCRNCESRISIRYPIVEAVTAISWVLVVRRFGLEAELAAYLLFATVLVILSFIDLEHGRLPTRIIGPSMFAGVILLAAASLSKQDYKSLLDAALGSAAYGLPLLALALAVPRGMGGGDVNLAGYLGLHLGWLSLLHVVVGAFSGFVLAGFTGIALIVSRVKGRKDKIPFGPFMALGAFVAVLAGKSLIRIWLGVTP